MLYDNDRCLVSRFERDGTRRRTQLFSGFLSHYLIRDQYGRPGKGNDKGAVEGLVGWSRRNFMVPLPRFASFEAFNEYLEQRCRERQGDVLRGHRESIGERLKRDLEAMAALPAAPFDACHQAPGQVSSQSRSRRSVVRSSSLAPPASPAMTSSAIRYRASSESILLRWADCAHRACARVLRPYSAIGMPWG